MDLRHPDNAVLDAAGARVTALCQNYAPPCAVTITPLVDAPSNDFASGLRERIARAAHDQGLPAMAILSAAGHDARHLANRISPFKRCVHEGGELSLAGGMAEDAFGALNCDLAFIGVAGVCATPGLTEYNPDDARVKRAAIAAARRSVVLADSSKLGRVAFATVAPLSAVDAVVTDAPAAHQAVSELVAAGAEVIEAKVPDAGESP